MGVVRGYTRREATARVDARGVVLVILAVHDG